MQANATPKYDDSVNTTGCCAKFNPDGWNNQELHFQSKPFVRAETRSVLHIPVNMGKVFSRVFSHLDAADAIRPDATFVLSKELSPWKAEHYFAVDKPIPDENVTTLSGDFITHVFEGSYQKAKDWYVEMQDLVRAQGTEPTDIYFFYTTCPKCAKAYGQNYVVGVARI